MGIAFNSLSRALDAPTPSLTSPCTPLAPRGFRVLTICVNMLGVLIAIKASKSTSGGSKGRMSCSKNLSHCEHRGCFISSQQERQRNVPQPLQWYPSSLSLNVMYFLGGILRGAAMPMCVCPHRSQVLETVDGLDICSSPDPPRLGHDINVKLASRPAVEPRATLSSRQIQRPGAPRWGARSRVGSNRL
jgi:hypothetical protein